ncbi:MAG: holo-ACP synthase [Oligosphaeraceae bacterium]
MPNSDALGTRILGLGVDLVEIPRLEASLRRTGELFLRKVYTPAELEAAPPREPLRTQYLAARWAAKEALSKALGTGITSRCALQDIEVLKLPSGQPRMTLRGAARRTADALGVEEIHLSLSHETHYALATVLLTGTPRKTEDGNGP